MNIFGFGGQSKEELKKIIIDKENLITILRDDKIAAQISESRAQSGFNAQKESDRGGYEITVAQLNREIEKLNADFEDYCDSFVASKTLSLEKVANEDRARTRKELRSEFSTELDVLKKSNKTNLEDSLKYKGLYDGTLLIIKSLETQNKTLVDLNASLVKALPTVSAEITTPNPSVVVGSGNKS